MAVFRDLHGPEPGLRVGAYTLVEVLVVVALLGFLAVLGMSFGNSILRRERVNAAALALASYIEEVRNLSLKKVGAITSSTAQSDRPCVIDFVNAASNLSAGSSIASVDPSTIFLDPQSADAPKNCAPLDNGSTTKDGSLVLPLKSDGIYEIAYQQSGLTGTPRIVFTPRGMWLPSSGASGDLTVKIVLKPFGPMRCVRISETLAYVDIGSSSSADSSLNCSDFVRM